MVANSCTSHCSKSVEYSRSEVDNGRLRYVMLEQDPECRTVFFCVPVLEFLQSAENIGLGRFGFRRRKTDKHRFRDRRKIRQHSLPCFAVAIPSELVAKNGERARD